MDSRCDALFAHLIASPLSHPNGTNWPRAGNLPEDGWAFQLPHGGWTPGVTLSFLTSSQVHYLTRMARFGFKQGICPKMGGLCNFPTGSGLPVGRSPCSPHRKSIILPEWPDLASSREFARRWGTCSWENLRALFFVQRLDGSLNSAIHITYRRWLRSLSMRESGDPPLKVFSPFLFSNTTIGPQFD